MNLAERIAVVSKNKKHLTKSLVGLEREWLRVSSEKYIATSKHPKIFGSALTNPYITTDFSEALLEIITPPSSIDEALTFLEDTQHFIYQNLAKDELLWAQSMPCVIRGKTQIPIAKYGTSNIGKMKEVYRIGLANRYGSSMQVISGVHFNYSYSKDFWLAYQKSLGNNQNIRNFIDDNYMATIRNLLRFGWIVVYLFGASPAICESFLLNYHKHSLTPLIPGTLYGKYATSLRMGDIGYQNLKEDTLGIKANYNSLLHYTNSLKLAMQTPCAKYQKIGVKVNNKYQQLNANILQIENEYYSTIRPKQTTIGLEKPTQALTRRGIEYIELRSLDINPLTPLGIDKEQILFLETFMLFCLLEPANIISSKERVNIDLNISNIAHNGRNNSIKLYNQDNVTSPRVWGNEICDKIQKCANLLSKKHKQAVSNIQKTFNNKKLLLSQQILDLMTKDSKGFFNISSKLSEQHQKSFKNKTINQAHFAKLRKVAKNSVLKQKILEQENISFDDYLKNYFTN